MQWNESTSYTGVVIKGCHKFRSIQILPTRPNVAEVLEDLEQITGHLTFIRNSNGASCLPYRAKTKYAEYKEANMGEKQFKQFQDANLKFGNEWEDHYLETLAGERIATDDPDIPAVFWTQHSILVTDARKIKALLEIQQPVLIYAGTQKLFDKISALRPDLKDIIFVHGWYEDDICFVMKRLPVQKPDASA
jgi:hypothetical protein